LGIENEMAQTSVVQITAMYCHGHFSPKAAKHLHSFRKNTKKKKYCPKVEFSPAPYIRIEAPANILFI